MQAVVEKMEAVAPTSADVHLPSGVITKASTTPKKAVMSFLYQLLFCQKVRTSPLAVFVSRVAPISASVAFWPQSCASTVNSTNGAHHLVARRMFNSHPCYRSAEC